jgi:hypothetical protein
MQVFVVFLIIAIAVRLYISRPCKHIWGNARPYQGFYSEESYKIQLRTFIHKCELCGIEEAFYKEETPPKRCEHEFVPCIGHEDYYTKAIKPILHLGYGPVGREWNWYIGRIHHLNNVVYKIDICKKCGHLHRYEPHSGQDIFDYIKLRH